jgi:hypothetical protein
MNQTEVTMRLNGVEVEHGPRRQPFWYAGQTLEICVDGQSFQLGTANGDDNNCLIDTLRRKLNERVGALIPEGCVPQVRARLEDRHRGRAAPIASGDYLDLADYWEDIVDLLESADQGRSIRPLGSARFEIMCVDMMWVGNGDRLPRRPDRGGRRTIYIARVNGNHFVPLRWVGNRRSLRPEAAAPQPRGGALSVAPTVEVIDSPSGGAPAPAASLPAGTASGGGGGQALLAPAEAFAQGGFQGARVPAASECPRRRASAREIAVAAAEERARREDPEERRQRLALAEHNKRQYLLGEVVAAHQAHGLPVEVGMNKWSDERLRETLQRLRGGGDVEVSEPTIVALSEAAL